jgi:hypothetical protein
MKTLQMHRRILGFDALDDFGRTASNFRYCIPRGMSARLPNSNQAFHVGVFRHTYNSGMGEWISTITIYQSTSNNRAIAESSVSDLDLREHICTSIHFSDYTYTVKCDSKHYGYHFMLFEGTREFGDMQLGKIQNYISSDKEMSDEKMTLLFLFGYTLVGLIRNSRWNRSEPPDDNALHPIIR